MPHVPPDKLPWRKKHALSSISVGVGAQLTRRALNRIFLYTGKDVPKAVIKTVSGTFSFVYGGDVNVVSENDVARADVLDQFEGGVLYSGEKLTVFAKRALLDLY
jgi:hypothetical protein